MPPESPLRRPQGQRQLRVSSYSPPWVEYDQARTRINGQTGILFVRNVLQQLLEPFASLRFHNPEFSQTRPQRINHLGLLPQQKIARAMLHEPALLLGRFRPHQSILGRRTASQIASASAASFLLRLT